MALKIVNGIMWSGNWISEYEGGYSVLAKISLSNELNQRQLCEQLFGVKPAAHSYSESHPRSLLRNAWMRAASNEIADALVNATPYYSYGYVGTQLFDDIRIKYCPECVSFGYHSHLCQMSALDKCPFHEVQLISACGYCKTPTARFALDEAFNDPLGCRVCKNGFSSSLRQSVSQKMSLSTISNAYGLVARALEGLAQLTWINRENWESPSAMGIVELRQSTVLAAVSPLLKACIPTEFLTAAASRAFESLNLVVSRRRAEPPNRQRRRKIYSDLVRKYHPAKSNLEQALRNESLKIDHFRERLEAVEVKDARLIAYAMWRNRFEKNVDIISIESAPNRLRLERIDFFEGWQVSDEDWKQFVIASFRAELSFATTWLAAIQGLHRHDFEWRELMGASFAVFSARLQPFAPEMAFFSQPLSGLETTVHLSWPSTGE